MEAKTAVGQNPLKTSYNRSALFFFLFNKWFTPYDQTFTGELQGLVPPAGCNPAPAHKKIDHTASNHPKDRALLPLALLRENTNLLTKRIGLQE